MLPGVINLLVQTWFHTKSHCNSTKAGESRSTLMCKTVLQFHISGECFILYHKLLTHLERGTPKCLVMLMVKVHFGTLICQAPVVFLKERLLPMLWWLYSSTSLVTTWRVVGSLLFELWWWLRVHVETKLRKWKIYHGLFARCLIPFQCNYLFHRQ